MKWKIPPKIKVHEALGSVADGRVQIISDNEAKAFSSSGNKFYTVKYDPANNEITCNDNGSFWVGYLGYPAIAFLMQTGVISYDKKIAQAFSGFMWKDINQKFKNDFAKTERLILDEVELKGLNLDVVNNEIENIYNQIVKLDLNKLGKTQKPPKGY